jgi:hypothetical protein
MFQSVTVPSTGLGQCADSGIEFISGLNNATATYTCDPCTWPTWYNAYTFTYYNAYMLGLHPSMWLEWVPSPSHQSPMIMSCLFSIEILNFSTANNEPFLWRGRPSFYFNSGYKTCHKMQSLCELFCYSAMTQYSNVRYFERRFVESMRAIRGQGLT